MALQSRYKIVVHKKWTPGFYRLALDAAPVAKKYEPGMFVNIKVAAGYEPFFRRPFSIMRAGKNVEILYEVVGRGTAILSGKKKGEWLDVVGPLGQGFVLPPKGTRRVALIAGGVGIAPFFGLAEMLKGRYEIIILYGGRSRAYVFPPADFKKNGCAVFVATEDGSAGVKGRVDKLFPKIMGGGKEVFLYTCGPRPMMAAVQSFAREHGLEGQASCEETMACGIGTCLGCAIETVSGYKTVCHDGPVFDLNEIVF